MFLCALVLDYRDGSQLKGAGWSEMVLRAVCVLLALATLVQGDGHDGRCTAECVDIAHMPSVLT